MVTPDSGVVAVSPRKTSTSPGASSRVPQTTLRSTCSMPCPMQAAPECTATRPPVTSRRTRPMSGTPTPMPTFLIAEAIPTVLPAVRASSYAARTASRVSMKRTSGSMVWPVENGQPARNPLVARNSSRSTPAASASRSTSASTAKATWGTPKPRIAPAGGLLVYTVRPSRRRAPKR